MSNVVELKLRRKPEMTSQEIGSALLIGWEAARKGEALDHSWGWHQVQGWRLYVSSHRVVTKGMDQ